MIKPSGGLTGNSSSILKTVIIDNSDVIRPYDAVKTRNGNLEAAAAGDAMFGIVIDIVDKNGMGISPVQTSLAVLGSATVGSTVVPPAVTVASNNETVDLISAKVDLSLASEYSADCNANPGVTVTSDKIGVWVDLSDQRTIGESTATRTVGTGGQFFGMGVDPLDSGNMLVHIHESEFYSVGVAVS